MNFEVFQDIDSVAQMSAETIATDARAAITERGLFTLAVSGGHTPWIMLRALANEDIPWEGVHIFQIDERVAPAGDPDRNFTALTGIYQGRRRMTLTYPAINRARRVFWVVTGTDKLEMLRRLREDDLSIPAGRVRRERAWVLADKAAAGQLAAEHKQGG